MPPFTQSWLSPLFPGLALPEIADLTGLDTRYLGFFAADPKRMTVLALRTLAETCGKPAYAVLVAAGFEAAAQAVGSGGYAREALTIQQYLKLLVTLREGARISRTATYGDLGTTGLQKIEAGTVGLTVPRAMTLARLYNVNLSSLILSAPRILSHNLKQAMPVGPVADKAPPAGPTPTRTKSPEAARAGSSFAVRRAQTVKNHALVQQAASVLIDAGIRASPGSSDYRIPLAAIFRGAFGRDPVRKQDSALVTFALARWRRKDGFRLLYTHRTNATHSRCGVFSAAGRRPRQIGTRKAVKRTLGASRRVRKARALENKLKQLALKLPSDPMVDVQEVALHSAPVPVQPRQAQPLPVPPTPAGFPQLVTAAELGNMISKLGSVKVEKVMIGGREFFAVIGG
jgi:hypothetical protein